MKLFRGRHLTTAQVPLKNHMAQWNENTLNVQITLASWRLRSTRITVLQSTGFHDQFLVPLLLRSPELAKGAARALEEKLQCKEFQSTTCESSIVAQQLNKKSIAFTILQEMPRYYTKMSETLTAVDES